MALSQYRKSVIVMATSVKPKELDVFKASTLLAKMYNKPKETTLNDILKTRAKMFNIKWRGTK
jgi:hypothetical protein